MNQENSLIDMEAALKPLLQKTGDSIADMLEQMLKGNWRDDHGHDVKMNATMITLKVVLIALGMFREEYLGYPTFDLSVGEEQEEQE